jgi:hypothetical protein
VEKKSDQLKTCGTSITLPVDKMRDAVEALTRRKFGEGGVYNSNTPGAWSDSPKVRGSAVPYTEEFKECIALHL